MRPTGSAILLRHEIVYGWSGREAVADVHETVAECAFVEKLEVGARVARKRGLAPADEHRMDEQVALVDQPGLERVRSKVRAAYREVTGG